MIPTPAKEISPMVAYPKSLFSILASNRWFRYDSSPLTSPSKSQKTATMIPTPAKEISPMVAYPKSLFSILASVGGLALFLIVASSLLISQPIGSSIGGYLYPVSQNLVANESSARKNDSNANIISKDLSTFNSSDSGGGYNEKAPEMIKKEASKFSSGVSLESGLDNSSEIQDNKNKSSVSNAEVHQTDENSKFSSPKLDSNEAAADKSKKSGAGLEDSGCDLYDGKWVYDKSGPLYSNNSCPVLTQMQNCRGNGRPDTEYENWRWKPAKCDLPRFDPKKFLELMRGKTLAFIGDSVARNQMESMLCILWQVEVPKNRGNKKMQRYYFRSTSTMIVRIWSSWLVHVTSEPFDFAPAGVDKLLLDSPDEHFMEFIPTFDVIVLSSGHWFAKRSVYILNNQIVGGQLWWPDKSKKMAVNNIEAFGISVETILSAIVNHPNYTGLTILRSFSPDHYEGGAWNTGGSCTGKVKPATDDELVENGFTNIMHEKQVTGFNRAMSKQANRSKLILMDITKAFSYRRDGHPGPYRSPDPNKITKRGPDGKPPPQDCLHWCMPGPVDTWNELVFEIIRREFESRQQKDL